jgi:hypothetical protein
MPNENRHELEAALADVHEQRERVRGTRRSRELPCSCGSCEATTRCNT